MGHELWDAREDVQRIQQQRANLAKAEQAYRDSGMKQWPWTLERRRAAFEGRMIPMGPDEELSEPAPFLKDVVRVSSFAEFHALRAQLDQQETWIRAKLHRSPEVKGRADELLRQAMPHVEALLPIAKELTELAALMWNSRVADGQAAGLEPRGHVDATDVVDAVLNPDLDVIEPVRMAAPRGAHFAFSMGRSDPGEPRVTPSQVREEAAARQMQRLRRGGIGRVVPGITVRNAGAMAQGKPEAEPEGDEPQAS
jgi:hypothetical protein